MQRNINSLIGYRILATDGEIGKVKEFYFDEETSVVRYLIIETGNWLTGKKVLLSPQALLAPSLDDRLFPVNLSREQIRNCPDIDTDKPFSRRQEIELHQHYSWQRYGGGGFYAGGSAGLLNQARMADETDIPEYNCADNRSEYDPHLRSTQSVTGYHIHTTDGDTGHVKDFIIDDLSWQITDLVIDTHNWIGGKKVLIPVHYIKEIQGNQFKILTDVSSKFIHDTPSFDESLFNHPLNAGIAKTY